MVSDICRFKNRLIRPYGFMGGLRSELNHGDKMVQYELNIAFNIDSYAQFLLKGESKDFEHANLKYKLTKISDIDDSYSLIIKPIKDMEHAKIVLNNIKLSLMLMVLKYDWISIEIDDVVKMANMLDEPKNIADDWIVSGDFDINQTMLIPITSNLMKFQAEPVTFTNIINIDKLIDSLEEVESLEYEKIIHNEKLSLALEIYLKHAKFSRRSQYLDLITILEILKPSYSVSEELIKLIEDFKNQLKSVRKWFEKDSEEYNEFNRYFGDIGHWKSKSINKSLQKFAKEHQDDFQEYENIDEKVREAYNIRNDIVHNGVIDDKFDEYFDFLKEFVGKLLKIMIYEM